MEERNVRAQNHLRRFRREIPVVVQQKWTQLLSMRMWVWSLALLRGLKTQHCHELLCRLQIHLGSGIAVTVAGSLSSDSTPSLGPAFKKAAGGGGGLCSGETQWTIESYMACRGNSVSKNTVIMFLSEWIFLLHLCRIFFQPFKDSHLGVAR